MSNLTKFDPGPMSEWAIMREQAQILVASRLLPRTVDTPEKAIAIIQTGRELGLGPMQSLRSIHVIEGKPTMSSELIAGLVLARLPGSTLRVASTSNEECVVKAARANQPETEFRFSMTDAKNAGLVSKDNWRKYPAAMLRARCLAAAARAIFPDASMGLYDPDELGAVTDERGQVVVSSATPLERELPRIDPHDDGADYSAADDSSFHPLLDQLHRCEALLEQCDSYDKTLALRTILGSKAKQSELTKAIQAAKEARLITPEQHKELSRIWQKVNRQVEKLEVSLKPDVTASFIDPGPEADPAEAWDRGAQ